MNVDIVYNLCDIKNAKGLHIAHLNVRSLVNKWDNIKANFTDSGLHILTFSETWLHDNLPSNLFDLGPEYTLIRNDRKWNDSNNTQLPFKKGGGICMYIKNVLQKPNKIILIGNLYRPPQGDISKCIDYLEEVLSDLDRQKIEVYLMGDINIDIMDRNNNHVKDLLNSTKQFGLLQLIEEPTSYSQIKDSCLDIVFTNSDIIANSGVCNLNISDHQMILLSRKKAKFEKQKCEFIGRSYRNYNKEIFQEHIRNANWDFLYNELPIDDQWFYFEKNISNIIDIMCPKKTFRINQIKQLWITPRLLELILDKDRALKNAKKIKNVELWKEAKRLRNVCTNRLRKAKADYVREQLEIHSNHQNFFLKNIQEVLPNKSKGTKPIILKDQMQHTEVDYNETADYINNFFINIGPNLAKDCNQNWQYKGVIFYHSLSDIETSIEIIELCKCININKSSCVDNLSSEILRDAFLAIPNILCDLFNNCFNTATIPNIWKHAKVTPLPKGGDSQLVSNYRPISLLPLLSKLIEKIVHRRLYTYLSTWNLLDEKQGGFRPGYSTVTTCSFFTNDIYTANNNNDVTIAVLIDAMKAFDTVNHQILIKKITKIWY